MSAMTATMIVHVNRLPRKMKAGASFGAAGSLREMAIRKSI